MTRAAGLTARTASHRTALAQAVNRLPGLLTAAQPALTRLDAVAVDGTPLVRQIHAAVPSLNRLSGDLGPFVTAARPALAKLSGALSKTIPALHDTAPLLRTLRVYADRAKPGTIETAKLVENLQRHGFVENFLSVVYYIGASLSRYDSTSHLLSILLIGPDNGVCGNYATTPVAACSAHYGSQPGYTPVAAGARAAHGRSPAATRGAQTGGPLPSLIGSARAGVKDTTVAGSATGTTGAPVSGAGSPTATSGATGTTGAPVSPTAPPAAPGGGTLQSLVNYLLK
jgi:hypothetical protein